MNKHQHEQIENLVNNRSLTSLKIKDVLNVRTFQDGSRIIELKTNDKLVLMEISLNVGFDLKAMFKGLTKIAVTDEEWLGE